MAERPPNARTRDQRAAARAGVVAAALPLVVVAAVATACGGSPPQSPVAASAPAASAPVPAASGLTVPLALSTAPVASEAPPAMASVVPPPPPPDPRSTKVTWKSDATWAACHRDFKATKRDVSKDVAGLASGCAKATKLKLAGKTLTGQQSDDGRPQSFPLKAEANHCYRVYAQASDGIRNLAVVVEDSTGAVASESSSDDASVVLPDAGAVCFTEADAATIVVSVGMGKGPYALEIWSD